jgi:23S rRNA (adenine2503-C2)-methyltransferase
VVFQGMGEPLANLDAVLQAIRVFSEPCAQGIDARAITVCTAGLPGGIRRLAAEAPRVRLAISISSAIAAHRKAVMPIADRHDFEDVIAAAADHARATGLAPMWAVTLLDEVNDSAGDAQALADRARAFHAATGARPRISLLDYNAIGDGDPFRRSPRMPAFRDVLSAAGLASHRRYSGGSDVGAACGQLARTAPAL